ncbi:GrpB family protein [Staphylococcus cornubiensis]|uniref:GrpB family protein n=1 Tax=Staphylococcus cornubiensis TaxID=1986155 RepID=UPI000A379987|nr:GrpB family protein [Staphylococcus cornubiensis]
MYRHVQPFMTENQQLFFATQYEKYRQILFDLLDSPVKFTQHIGGTFHFNYPTEPILDILVGVENLHDITALDEKRLNYAGFYRLHHAYEKKVVMAKFNNLNELKQEVRLHIIQMHTPTFQKYQQYHELLTHHPAAIQFFQAQKTSLEQQLMPIRDYEKLKTQWFNQLQQYTS